MAKGKHEGSRLSLQGQLLLWINGTVIVVLTLFALWDYHRQKHKAVAERRQALSDEAEILLLGLNQLETGSEARQTLVDEACEKMAERFSPGHHIVVRTGDHILQARSHGRASSEMLEGALRGARSPENIAEVGGRSLIVGGAQRGDTVVLISEYLSDLEHGIRADFLRRLLGVLLVGLALILIVNMLIRRLVSRPLRTIVEGLRRIREGELGEVLPCVESRELDIVAREISAMSAALGKAERERALQLQKARRVQRHLIPETNGGEKPGLHYVYEPAEAVGGDYLDVVRAEERTLFCVADVTGHGVPAAMGSAMLKTLFSHMATARATPSQILAALNQGFMSISLEEDFATMFVGVFDADTNELEYGSAGHEYVYLLRRDGPTEVLESTGTALSVSQGLSWETVSLSVSAGDRLVISTDGVTEAMSREAGAFGRDRFVRLLEANRAETAEELTDRILERIRAFRDGQAQADDVTILVVDF